MKQIVMYTPSISSINMGDSIIYDSIQNELSELLDNSFKIEISTHLPISLLYSRLFKYAEYKFVCGSNLLMGNLFGRFRQWDINIFNAKSIGPTILLGVGWWQYNNKPNLYTKIVYKRVLDSKYLHSVRDEYTKNMLKSIGIENVINTSCPTMWRLTPEFCVEIPRKKARNVITTLTDYNRDIDRDRILLEILLKNYEKVYLWLQGINDLNYFKELNIPDKIELIYPNLKLYDDLLIKEDNIDYVGTRLHAGIRALQHKKRSIIIAVDNRAIEKQKDFDLTVIKRSEINTLEMLINSSFETKIRIPHKEIEMWKQQFLNKG